MKSRVEYEASDIDLTNNKLHGVISVAIPLISLTYTPKSIDGESRDEEIDNVSKNAVAMFLNMLDSVGYIIIKKEESVPEAFYR